MNLETAHKIIEQEALLFVIANPKLSFDINSRTDLFIIFSNNESQVVTIYCMNGHHTIKTDVYFTALKINHPQHGIGYYIIESNYEDGYMIEQSSMELLT